MRNLDYYQSAKLPHKFLSKLTVLHQYLASKAFLKSIHLDSIHIQGFSNGVNRIYFYDGKELCWLLFDISQVDYVCYKRGKCIVRIADTCMEVPCSAANFLAIADCLLRSKFKVMGKDEFISSDLILQLQDLANGFKNKVIDEMEVHNGSN